MPCHVDPIYPKDDQIDQVIEIIKGNIKFISRGDNFMGNYPTVKDIVKEYREKLKTFNYKVSGSTLVLISPCPKKC